MAFFISIKMGVKGIPKEFLSEEKQKEINKMFFGPYEESWKDKNDIVDNRDIVIAKRLNLKTTTVANYISKILNKKEEELNCKIKNNR